MAETLNVISGTKSDKYASLLPQIKALLEGETNLTANLANCSSALKMAFGHFWVGFYVVENDELVLGPFQGDIACTRIAKGRGVCGSSWLKDETIIVPNVDEFPGHIACSNASKSEIVVPLRKNGEIVAVLDADSDKLNDFDEQDAEYLNELCEWLGNYCF